MVVRKNINETIIFECCDMSRGKNITDKTKMEITIQLCYPVNENQMIGKDNVKGE